MVLIKGGKYLGGMGTFRPIHNSGQLGFYNFLKVTGFALSSCLFP